MKKVISSLLVAAMALCVNTAKADNISLEEAQEAAAYYMGYYTGAAKLSANDLTLVHQIDNEKLGIPASYFFNVGSEGWIIMAGTTTIDPIIGFSADGSLVMEELPDNMMWWVNGYTEMVKEIQELDATNDYPDHEMWTALKNKSYKGGTKANQHILTQLRWGQGDAYEPTYNLYCPQDTGGRYSMVGCVATAMSQIIRYYQYPQQASGSAIYVLRSRLSGSDKYLMPNIQLSIRFDTTAPFDYSMMPLRPATDGGRLCSEDEMREVARLSYYAGVTVKMGYTPDGSGALSTEVPSAMKTNFKYKLGRLVYRASNNDTQYMSRLRAMLLDDNIVYMGGASLTGDGADAAGHAWLCVGYQENYPNLYYMNWGWNGGGNGYFNLGQNSMPISGYGYNFNQRQEFIEGMVPDVQSSGIDRVDGSELGAAYPNPAINSVTLPYSTPNACEVTIYNIEGKVVATYPVNAGTGELTVNVDGMPSGMYVYRMNSVSGRFMVK